MQHGFRDISIFVFCIFCAKIRKIQNGRHFWQDKIFLNIGMGTLQRYPVGQKFRRNRSIYLNLRKIGYLQYF